MVTNIDSHKEKGDATDENMRGSPKHTEGGEDEQSEITSYSAN